MCAAFVVSGCGSGSGSVHSLVVVIDSVFYSLVPKIEMLLEPLILATPATEFTDFSMLFRLSAQSR